MSDSNSATQKTLKTSFTTPKSSKTCFLSIWKNWHFRGKSWHILVQKAQIEKWMSDSDSAGQIYLGNTLFSIKKFFWKKCILGGGCKEVPIFFNSLKISTYIGFRGRWIRIWHYIFNLRHLYQDMSTFTTKMSTFSSWYKICFEGFWGILKQ